MGYEVGDYPDELGLPRPMDPAVTWTRHEQQECKRRPVVATSLGVDLVCAPFVPSRTHVQSAELGAQHRVYCEKLKFDHAMMQKFRFFAHRFVRRMFPQYITTLMTYEQWRETRVNYGPSRLAQLDRAYARHGGQWEKVACEPRFTRNQIHIKAECYPGAPKYPRIISAREDEFKTLVGPFFHQVEEMVFHLPYFIKHVPVRDRPSYIEKFFSVGKSGQCLGTNDFSSFESLIYGKLQRCSELELYRWLGRGLDQGFVDFVCKTIGGRQIHYNRRGWKAACRGRQSGDMCTSVGNGWVNFCVMSFVAAECGWVERGEPIKGLFEGDDSIFSCEPGNRSDLVLKQLGMRAKLASGVQPGEMGFLSTYWGSDLVPITDPRRHISRFNYVLYKETNARVRKELLRAKSLSLAFEYAGCPLLRGLALLGLRLSEGHGPRFAHSDRYRAQQLWGTLQNCMLSDELQRRLEEPIPADRRLLYARLFGVNIAHQEVIESALASVSGQGAVYIPALVSVLGMAEVRHFLRFRLPDGDENTRCVI